MKPSQTASSSQVGQSWEQTRHARLLALVDLVDWFQEVTARAIVVTVFWAPGLVRLLRMHHSE